MNDTFFSWYLTLIFEINPQKLSSEWIRLFLNRLQEEYFGTRFDKFLVLILSYGHFLCIILNSSYIYLISSIYDKLEKYLFREMTISVSHFSDVFEKYYFALKESQNSNSSLKYPCVIYRLYNIVNLLICLIGRVWIISYFY